MNRRNLVIASPFLIIATNLASAYVFGKLMGKWAFVPMILIGWSLWSFFILKYGGAISIKKWLKKPEGKFRINLWAILVGLIPLPLFLSNYETLFDWQIWLPTLFFVLINPWIEEFYWRGLLLDYTKKWPEWIGILFISSLFAFNHIAFGINSQLINGFEFIISTFIMGVIWAIVYKKTKSLRWCVFSHFMVDFLALSVPAFLDLFDKGGW